MDSRLVNGKKTRERKKERVREVFIIHILQIK